MKTRESRRAIIGWSEYVDLPLWGITGLKAKVDTGARTSALHVENLEALEGGRVRFDVVLSRQNVLKRVRIEADCLRWARVRSSTGIFRKRCFVKTMMKLGAVEKEIELSLVSREKMLFRMLLGRQALGRDFLVDVSRTAALTQRPVRKTRSSKP